MDPVVIAHRGDSAHAPENTLAAFRQAIAKGTDWIETDLQLSGDGEVIVFHDDTLDRLAGAPGPPGERTAAELTQMHILVDRFGENPEHRICTLSEVLAGPGADVPFYLELKSVGRGRSDPTNARLLERVLDLVPPESPHALASFDPDLVRGALDAGRPAIHIVTGKRGIREDILGQLLALSVRYPQINEPLLDRCFQAQVQVWAWTVDRPRDIRDLVERGVQGICTNDVDAAVAALAEDP